ncbi:MAG: hypothetical protein KGS61_13220, partial [Verrucomicrobia bacterium]|nr:hypothetical protein [Verrucomicrobiota bacterium]
DGLHWTTAFASNPLLHGVAYGNRHCLGVGDNGTVLISDTIADSAPVILGQPQSHTLAAGLPVTLGINAQSRLAIAYQWLKNGAIIPGATNSTLALSAVQAGDAGQYTVQVANGQAAVVSNPAWIEIAAAGPTNSPVARWQSLPTAVAGTNDLFSIAGGWSQGFYSPNSTIAVVGAGGTGFSSANAGPWTSDFAPTTNGIAGVVCGQAVLPFLGAQPTFVAVGGDGTILTASIDNWGGLTWQPQTSGTTNFLERVTFGDGLFVAVGDNGTLLTSTNSTDWVPRDPGTTQNLLGAAVGTVNSNLVAVAVGDSGTLLTSTNGSDWSGQGTGLTNDLLGVSFCAGQFVVVGVGGTILTSPDGVTWQSRASPVASDLWSVASAVGYLVAVGADGAIISSPDAVHWTAQVSGVSNTLYEVTFAAGAFWAVGDTGTILRSDDVVALRWLSFPNALLGLTAPPAHFYRLEATGPLEGVNDWLWQTTVYAPSNSPPETPMFVPDAADSAPRFWRGVQLP